MPDGVDQPSKPIRTWRPMALGTAGILLALGLAWVGAKCWEVWNTSSVLSTPMLSDEDVVAALGGPDRALPRLRNHLRLSDSLAQHKLRAVGAMGSCGPEAVPDLLLLLRHHDLLFRHAAAYALGTIHPVAVDAAPALTEALSDPDRAVRQAAADALCEIGNAAPNVVPVASLIKALQDPDEDVRLSAALALGEAGPLGQEAIPALVAALEDPAADVRSAATEALRKIRGEEAKRRTAPAGQRRPRQEVP
jgi:HEAT repeat protein